MKTRILFIIIALAVSPVFVHAQAARTFPKSAMDTHSSAASPKTQSLNAAITRQVAVAQVHAARPFQPHSATPKGSSLTKEELADGKDYIVTPAGNIKKTSWQACEYFYNWQKRQAELNMPESQIEIDRERILIQFDISDEYCQVVAQARTPATLNLETFPAASLTPVDLTVSVNPNVQLPAINPAEIAASHPIIAEQKNPILRGQTNMDQKFDIPVGITKRKAKRYLKHFVRENYTNLHAALENREQGQRLSVAQHRAFTSYDSLCAWYEGTHHQPCPPPEAFL